MLDRIEKIEEELNVIRYNFEFTKQFIESDKEKTEAMQLFTNTMLEFMKDTNEKILDLQDSFVLISKNNALHLQLIESQGSTINTLIKTIETLTKK